MSGAGIVVVVDGLLEVRGRIGLVEASLKEEKRTRGEALREMDV